jgi:TPR repeat protein
MKKCVECGFQLEVNSKFCAECGTKQPEQKTENQHAGVNIGDGNVMSIAGDITKNKTVIQAQNYQQIVDDTKKIIECGVSGKRCMISESIMCLICGKDVSKEHYVEKTKRCENCEKKAIITYTKEVEKALEDGIITSEEKLHLDRLAPQLLISSEKQQDIEKKVRNKKQTSGSALSGMEQKLLNSAIETIIKGDLEKGHEMVKMIAQETGNAEALFWNFLTKAILLPEKAEKEYENRSADDVFWQQYWMFLVYLKNGNALRATRIISNNRNHFPDHAEDMKLAEIAWYLCSDDEDYKSDAKKLMENLDTSAISAPLLNFEKSLRRALISDSEEQLEDKAILEFWLKKVLGDKVKIVSKTKTFKCGKNLTATLDDKGTFTIIGEGEMVNYAIQKDVPWYNELESIKTIIFEEGVTSVGDRAFSSFGGTSITIPVNVTRIGKRAFCESALEVVEISCDIKMIDDEAFYGCDSLNSITIRSYDVPKLGEDVFYEVDTESCKLYVQENCFFCYEDIEQWSDFENRLYIEDDGGYEIYCAKCENHYNASEDVCPFCEDDDDEPKPKKPAIKMPVAKKTTETKTPIVEEKKTPEQILEEYQRLSDKEQNVEAFNLIRPLAEQGNAKAQEKLADSYEKGKGVEQSFKEAFQWYKKAAEQGEALAQCNLGSMYALGRGCDKNEEEAFLWHKKSAEQGNYIGQKCFAYSYQSGIGSSKDREEALPLFKKLAEQGDEGINHVIQYVKTKAETKKEAPPKVETKTPEQILEEYQSLYDKEEYEDAFNKIRSLAEQGNAEAQRKLARLYWFGKGVDENEKEAVKWFEKAAKQGDAISQTRLGLILWKSGGKKGKAIEWFEKSAEQGEKHAQLYLGEISEKMFNTTEAIKWYKQAAEQGMATAQFCLGRAYERQKVMGISTNKKEAIEWYKKAAEQRYIGAVVRLTKLGVNTETYVSSGKNERSAITGEVYR